MKENNNTRDKPELLAPKRCRGNGSFQPGFDRAMNAQQRAVISAPDDKGPRRPMPQAAEQHRHHQVEIGAACSATVAAERDVEVIAQPGAEADVPAAPEV